MMWWLYAPVGPGEHGPDEEMAWRDAGSPTTRGDRRPVLTVASDLAFAANANAVALAQPNPPLGVVHMTVLGADGQERVHLVHRDGRCVPPLERRP